MIGLESDKNVAIVHCTFVQISYFRSKYKYRSSTAVPSDHVTSPQSLLHEESVVDRFIKVANHLVGNVDIP